MLHKEPPVSQGGGENGANHTRGNVFAKKWIMLLFFYLSRDPNIRSLQVWVPVYGDMKIHYTILFTFVFWNFS